jgi:hypothetical protein
MVMNQDQDDGEYGAEVPEDYNPHADATQCVVCGSWTDNNCVNPKVRDVYTCWDCREGMD